MAMANDSMGTGPRWCAWQKPYTVLVNLQFHVCTSLAPRPMAMVCGLGTRLRVHMRTTFENALNGSICNGQQAGSTVNSFYRPG